MKKLTTKIGLAAVMKHNSTRINIVCDLTKYDLRPAASCYHIADEDLAMMILKHPQFSFFVMEVT